MNVLFVLHESNFIYGANRSLLELLKAIDFDFDVLIGKSFTKKVDADEIRNYIGAHLNNIYICRLPRYRCCYYNKIGIISEWSHYINNIMAFLFSGRRKKIIKKGNYDFVHLNSIVLFPVIDNYAKYILHVREIFNSDYYNIEKFKEKAIKARGIICIDEITKESLKQYIHEESVFVLNNPFNMLGLENIDYEKALKRYGLSKENTVFALIGQVTEIKGAKFVIQSFMRHFNSKSRLLIVGNYNHSYGRECQNMAQSDERIIFCGELKDTSEIYRISDYILRGDSQICIGRTMYEGLYAGAGIIIPGNTDNMYLFPEKDEFKGKIFFYTARDENDLANIIEERSKIKQTNRILRCNTEKYVNEYKKYIYKLANQENV